jgi:hypothetical protein
MKAETLMVWDRLELARVLANQLADPEDLLEAFPVIAEAGALEESLLPEFIEQNWRMILHDFDRREVEAWLEEKETDESYEQWENAWLEYNHDYAEYMDEEYCAALLELVNSFKDTDSDWLHENRYS